MYDETGNLPRIYLGTDTRMSSICAGAMLAIIAPKLLLFINSKLRKKELLWGFLGVLSTLFIISLLIRNNHFRDTFRFSLQELATCLLILLGPILGWTPQSLRKAIQSRFVQLIGVSSYCIYLSHLMLILLFQKLFVSSQGSFHVLIDFAFASTTIVIGIILYWITDKPFEAMRLRFRR